MTTNDTYERLIDEALGWIEAESMHGRTPDPDSASEFVDLLDPDADPVGTRSLLPARVLLASLVAVSLPAVAIVERGLLDALWSITGLGSALLLPHVGRHTPSQPVKTYRVVPEVAYVEALTRDAAQRLADLHASADVIGQINAARLVVEREIPRLPDIAWHAIWARKVVVGWTNHQATTVAYERLMRTGAEVLLVLRAAEEKEFALDPRTTLLGPWSSVSLLSAVAELSAEADLVRQMISAPPEQLVALDPS